MLLACGGYNGNSLNPVVITNIKNRVFVTNTLTGLVDILDATNDLAGTVTIPTGGQPTLMVLAPSQFTLVFNQDNFNAVIIDNTNETVASSIALPGPTDSIVLSNDAKTGYAAIRNLGEIAVMDIVGKTVTTVTGIPQVHRLVISHNGSKVLAFSDNSDSVTIMNASDKVLTTVAGFDRAYT